MASIPTHGSGSKSAHRTLAASASAAVSASMGARGSIGVKRIVSGGSISSMEANVATVNKSSIVGPDKGEG